MARRLLFSSLGQLTMTVMGTVATSTNGCASKNMGLRSPFNRQSGIPVTAQI
jgi:hypothetical protein